ncbi:MAG: sugar kinase [Betaproteobacteria bacterium]|nr:sugar kinase [Betaproteobacteria bacterium]
MARFDIVSIGEPMIEFNQTRPAETAYLQGFGGDTSNAAIAAARQGAKVAYVTRLGDDDFARLFLALWREEGVDASGVALDRSAFTAVYFVRHGPNGHTFHYLRAGSAASRMRPQELPMDVIRDARIVHASGISMAISPSAFRSVITSYKEARTVQAKLSFDSNLRLKLWPIEEARAAMAQAIALADYFFPSLEDAQALSGASDPQAILDWAHGLGAKNVFLKLGADGVIVSDGASRKTVPGLKMKSVDATGAGDCFCGAALARLAAGDSPLEAARYANAAAALKTTGFGAVAPLPRPEAVRKVLEQLS